MRKTRILFIFSSFFAAPLFAGEEFAKLTMLGQDYEIREAIPPKPGLPRGYKIGKKTDGEAGAEPEIIIEGWDVNLDGVVDSVRFLNKNGKVMRQLYDFNFDGKADHEKTTPQ